jgi:hypothetical protein
MAIVEVGPVQVVRIDKKGRALEHVVTVSKDLGERVLWVALSNEGPWKVTFDKGTGSPFGATSFTVPKGGLVTTTTGPDSGTAGVTYKYNVRNATTNEITDDPDVDVET